MTRRTILSLTLAALAVAAAGCAPASFPIGRAGDFVLLTGERGFVTAAVAERGILGAEINLGRFEQPEGEALRGVAFGQPVNISVRGRQASGIVGTTPLQLTISPTAEGGLRARGLVRGAISDYRLDAFRLTGHIGPCSYDLDRTSGGYAGVRSCAGQIETAQVAIGRGFQGWSGGALMAALGVLLSR